MAGVAALQLSVPTIQQRLSAAYAAAAQKPANTGAGAALGPVFNAIASVMGLDLQQQVLYIASVSRLVSSYGADVDSYVNPFNVYRILATAATMPLVFSTPSPVVSTTYVSPGIIAQQANGTQYVVLGNPANSLGWPITAGTSSTTVQAQCLSVGSVGNCIAGAINQLYAGYGSPSISGISAVTNPAAVSSGTDAESDAALKARFTIIISSGRYGTIAAIAAAVISTQTNLTYQLGNYMNPDGSYHPAWVSIIVNNIGSASAPSNTLLANVAANVLAVRPAGLEYEVYAPTLLDVLLAGTVYVRAGYEPATVITNAQIVAQNFVNAIGLSTNGSTTTLSYAQLVSTVLAVPGVQNAVLTMNGAALDITAAFASEIVCPLAPNFVAG